MPKELTSEPQLEKVQSAKVESAVKESPTNPHPEKVQSAKAEPEKPVALKEKEKTRSEKSQTAKAEPDKLKAAKGLVGSPPAEKIKSAKTEPEKPAVVKETAAKSEKVQSAKVEPDKLPGTKEPEAKNRGGKTQSAKAEPEQSSVVKESAIKSQKVQTAKIEPEKAAPKESARSEKVQAAKVELPKAVKEKTIPNSRSEQVQLAKFEPIKPPGAKEPVVSLQPEKTQTDKPEAAKIPSQEPTVDIQLSDRTTETAATKLADGFDFPVGKPEAEGYYKARGFRSGGFNGRPTAVEEIGSYDPEKLTAYEVGLKTSFGRIATINLAVFRNDYTDQQLLISTVSPVSGLLVVRNENAGKSRIQGIELEGNVRVSRAFSLIGAFGYLDAKYLRYTSVINGVTTDVSDRTPKQAPDLTGSLSAVLELPLSDRIDGTFRIDSTYRSQVYVDVENSALLRAPDNVILNASAEFALPANGLSVRFAVDNLTDKQVLTAGYDARSSFGFVEGYYSQPRRYSVTLAFRR